MLRRFVAPALALLALPAAALVGADAVVLPQPAPQGPTTEGDPDEAALRRAGVGLTPAELLAHVRNYVRADLDPAAFAALAGRLGSEDHDVREGATRAIVALGRPALPHLRALLGHADPEVRRRAGYCLEDIEAAQDGAVALAAVRRLVSLRVAGAAGPLLAYLPDADADTELAILAGLAAVGRIDGKPDPALAAALTDPLSARRAAAALTLGRLGAVEPARNGLVDKDPLVRLRAAQGLLAARSDAGVPGLLDLLAAAPVEVAWQAEELLTWAAAGTGPTGTPLGAGGEEERRRCRDAWAAWWRGRRGLDWARLDADHRRPGLYLVCDGNGVFLCGCDGRPRWRRGDDLGQPADARLLPGGRLLVADADKNEVRELDLAGKVSWRRGFNNGEIVLACQPLPGGNVFIVTDECLVETTPAGLDVFHYRPANGESIYDAVKASPTRIVAVLDRGLVVLDPATAAVRQRVQQGRNWFVECRVAVLPGGEYLLADNSQNRVVRLDGAGKAVWHMTLAGVSSVEPLPGGHFLTTAAEDEGRVAEHAPDGRVLWEAFPEGGVARARPCLTAVRIGLGRPRPEGLNLDTVAYRTSTLTSPDVVLRRRAASYLGKMADKAASAVPALVEALADEDAEVRARSGAALARVGEPALAPLLKALKERPAVQVEAARALAQMGAGAKAAVPALTAFVADRGADTTLRRECATALGAVGGASAPAAPTLLEALAGGPAPLREASARALGQIGAEPDRVVAALTTALKDEELLVRAGAAAALGQFGERAKAAVPALVVALKTTEVPGEAAHRVAEVRTAAAVALGQIGPAATAAALPLAEAMKDATPANRALRRAAVAALGQLKAGAKPALPAFEEVLRTPELPADTARALTQALQAMGADGVPTLAAAVKAGNRFTRRHAITSLAALGAAARPALPALREAAKDMDASIAAAANRAIQRIGAEEKGGR
jgi:HEAT repeat protein